MHVERRLGDNEKMTWMLDQAAPMNFVMVARIEGELKTEAINDSLVALFQMHPLLATRIEQRNDELWVVTNDKAKPSLRVVERENDEHWHTEVEKEINTPFDCFHDPLLRVTLIQSATVNELLLNFYHIISDGNSGVFAVRDLLSLIANWKPGVLPVIPGILPVRSPVEELLPPAAHGWSKFRKTLALIAKQIVNNFSDPPLKLSATETPRKQRYTKIIHQILPQATVDTLVTKSRAQNTTVHGALTAALLIAISRQIESGTKLTLSCTSVVDLRNMLSPRLGDEIGMLASGVITAHKLRPAPEFWTLAQKVKQSISRAIKSGEIFITMTLVGNIIPKNSPPEVVADNITKLFPYASIITNIGKVEIPENYGTLKLKQLHFTVALKSLSGKEFNLAAATFAGQMQLNFIYTSPNLADETAWRIANDMIAILKENI
jgi:NRPS condensation-like uncharacterized protein